MSSLTAPIKTRVEEPWFTTCAVKTNCQYPGIAVDIYRFYANACNKILKLQHGFKGGFDELLTWLENDRIDISIPDYEITADRVSKLSALLPPFAMSEQVVLVNPQEAFALATPWTPFSVAVWAIGIIIIGICLIASLILDEGFASLANSKIKPVRLFNMWYHFHFGRRRFIWNGFSPMGLFTVILALASFVTQLTYKNWFVKTLTVDKNAFLSKFSTRQRLAKTILSDGYLPLVANPGWKSIEWYKSSRTLGKVLEERMITVQPRQKTIRFLQRPSGTLLLGFTAIGAKNLQYRFPNVHCVKLIDSPPAYAMGTFVSRNSTMLGQLEPATAIMMETGIASRALRRYNRGGEERSTPFFGKVQSHQLGSYKHLIGLYVMLVILNIGILFRERARSGQIMFVEE